MADYTLVESKTESDATDDVITFSGEVKVIEIYHSETTIQVFTVNGLDINVPPNGYISRVLGTPSDEVTIPTGITGIVVNRKF